MDRLINKIIFLLFMCFSTASGMQSIVIQNKMDNDLYIENFFTNGSVVFDDIQLVCSCLERNDCKSIQIGIVSSCAQEDNYAVLNLFNKKSDQYERVKLMWGDEGISIENNRYVVGDFYRVSQYSDDKGRVVITFYEDRPDVVELLRADALLRLNINRGTQQKQSEAKIKMFCGLLPKDLLTK